MKRVIVAACVAAVFFGLSCAVSAQTIKFGTLAPEGSPWYKIFRDMAEEWSRATNEKIRFRIYAGGVAGDEPDMVRKMRVGQLHAAALSGAGLSQIAGDIQALQMPMMLASYEELDYVRERLASRLEAILETKGFKVLNWGDAGWVRFFTKRPVVHPEDLKPLRLFVWAGDTAYVEAWKDAGYQPVPLAATEIHTALQSGLIDAFATTPIASLSFQWFALANHMTDLNWAPLVAATVISTKIWQQIPDQVKPLLVESGRQAGLRTRQETRKFSDEAVAVMKKHGLVVHSVPARVVTEWERRARRGYSKLVGRVVPADVVAEVERLRNEHRASQKAN